MMLNFQHEKLLLRAAASPEQHMHHLQKHSSAGWPCCVYALLLKLDGKCVKNTVLSCFSSEFASENIVPLYQ